MDIAAQSGSTKPMPNRNRSLDSFRAIFVFGVLAYHYTVRWTPPEHPVDLYHYDRHYSSYLELGKFGVHAFFLLSGFFITVTLVRSKGPIEFLYKRIYRIYPSFLIACTFTFIVTSVYAPPDFKVTLKDYFLSLTLVPKNLGGLPVDAAYWSLAIEVKFYVLVAVIYGVLREKFWMGLIAAAALGFALEFWHPALARGVFLSQYMSFFLAGTALAFQTTLQKGHAALTLYASAAIAYVAHWQTISLHDGSTLLPNLVVIGAILAVILVTIKGIRIDYGPLPFLGIISYEIYLLHQRLGVIVISIAKGRLGTSDLLAGLLAAGLCTSSAFIVNRYLQKPVQGLIGAFWRRLRPE